MQCTYTTCFSILLAEITGKVHAFLPHVAEDEIASSDDGSLDSEESNIELVVVCVPAPPTVDGDVCVDESDVYVHLLICPSPHSLVLTTLSIRH